MELQEPKELKVDPSYGEKFSVKKVFSRKLDPQGMLV